MISKLGSFALLAAFWAAQFVLAQNVVGHLEIHSFESDVFGNARKLRIWLPPDYFTESNKDRVYPVLYLNDGQNLFDTESSVFSDLEWEADESASPLIKSGAVPPLIVVGIDNAGRRGRAREYLPYPDSFLDPPEPNPQGHRYPEFLRREVIPFIENRYRVDSTRSGRMVGGSSYGALISMYVAVSDPELFSGLLLESPSFYVDDDRIFAEVDSTTLCLDRVYLGVGTNELALTDCPHHPGNQEAVDGVAQMASILRSKGFVDGQSLFVRVDRCAEHTEAAWAARLPGALEFLFGKRTTPRPHR